MTTRLWKINCTEDKYPGLWQRWFKNQCVAVSWAGEWGYHLHGKKTEDDGWIRARTALKEIGRGDFIVVSLSGHRIGRLGQVIAKEIEDSEWNPLVPRSKRQRDGEMGRRVQVRWDLTAGPDDREMVVLLPQGKRLTPAELRPTISEIKSQTLDEFRETMRDEANWVSLSSRFSYERSLSDYVGSYPHHLEDGLLPHSNKKVRERVFRSSGRQRQRLDVLLEDRDGKPVIVECKQHQPSVRDIQQLQKYLKRFEEEEGIRARGILIHGGARKLRKDVRTAARSGPRVELVQFSVRVDFSRSG